VPVSKWFSRFVRFSFNLLLAAAPIGGIHFRRKEKALGALTTGTTGSRKARQEGAPSLHIRGPDHIDIVAGERPSLSPPRPVFI